MIERIKLKSGVWSSEDLAWSIMGMGKCSSCKTVVSIVPYQSYPNLASVWRKENSTYRSAPNRHWHTLYPSFQASTLAVPTPILKSSKIQHPILHFPSPIEFIQVPPHSSIPPMPFFSPSPSFTVASIYAFS
jgi:hypothetical protein